MKKNVAFILILALLVVAFSACTKKDTPEPSAAATTAPTAAAETAAPPEATPEATPVPAKEWAGEININSPSTNSAGWNAVAAAYNKLNPKVKVNVEMKPSAGYADWLRAQLTSDKPTPDIVVNNTVVDLQRTKFVDFKPYYDQPNPYNNNANWKDGFKDFSTQTVDGVTGGIYNINLETVQVAWFYNKTMFEKAGITTPPTTWDELIEVSKKLKAAGFTPLGLGGTSDDFWLGAMGWMARIYADSFQRTEFEKVRCQENDYCYDPEVDGEWKLDITDPHNDDDANVNKNPLRQALAIQKGDINVTNDGYKTIYTNFKKMIPEYTQPGFFGTNEASAYTLFLTQKAAIHIDIAGLITSLDKDLKDATKNGGNKDGLPAFEYGLFPMPTMKESQAPVRTIEVPIGFLGVVKKEQEQNDLNMDFMKYYASPAGYSIYLDATFKDGKGINGPPILKDVTLEPNLQEKFDALKLLGNAEKNNSMHIMSRGIFDFQPSVREWTGLAQQFFSDKLPLDDFLTQYEKSIQKNLEAALQAQKIELVDLKTPEKKSPERK
ncbi:carbohydrate ABC transporter substrate-binding protein [Paenibacillus psychroresistens]|uniref:Carbohydrate ABC transporter substrate-binding protein n=1 Tax=Paenibacillus psychroresistens TaxID=1778678 RepID=A0A6B8RUS4_9BACL|nr:ABC transporter substrate-binding protein [Paenibacillus psychroresistens]QGQ99687.1 carbohydrate ABC transporter substrate-binding protein [Paenibacillus psychroresistens]